MDLMLINTEGEQDGYVKNFYLDMEVGSGNTFVITVPKGSELTYGCMIAEAGTEFGGIITNIETNTSDTTVTWGGRTFRGMFEKRIIRPANEGVDDYRTASGNVATIINAFLKEFGLNSLFVCDESAYAVTYQFERYVTFLHGINRMLESIGCILTFQYNDTDNMVHIIVKEATDHSDNVELSNDYKIKIKFNADKGTVNHLVCLGKGELHERVVIDLYVDAEGRISQEQTFTGLDEVVEVYENTSCEAEELMPYGIQQLQDIVRQTAEFTIDEIEDMELEVGDIVGAREYTTGINFKHTIIRKIIRGYEDKKTIEYN